jgi:hypothetical protein
VTDGYRSLVEKPYESVYLHADTIIDHPVEKVWPQVLNIGGWMSAHGLETVAGEPGKVGHFEKVVPRQLGPDVPLPHYHLYGVAEIIPYKLVVLEVLPEKGGSYGKTRQTMSFDSILLTDLGDKTALVFLMIDVHAGRGEADFLARRKRELKEARGLLEQYFENLQRLVEQGA